MTLIVENICRFAFNGTYLDRPWVNIMDMQIDTTGTFGSRSDGIYACAGNLINAWVDELSVQLQDDVELESVSWVDLNSEDGTTGSRSSTSEHTLPATGQLTGEPSAGNLAVLIRKETIPRRGQRHGRWYQVGIGEGATLGNTLDAPTLANWQTRWDNFWDIIDHDDGGTGLYTAHPVVVHTTAADPKFGTYTHVENFVVQPRLATQRRRLRG